MVTPPPGVALTGFNGAGHHGAFDRRVEQPLDPDLNKDKDRLPLRARRKKEEESPGRRIGTDRTHGRSWEICFFALTSGSAYMRNGSIQKVMAFMP